MNNITEDLGSTKCAPVPRPVVTLSYAQTLGGRLLTSTGSSTRGAFARCWRKEGHR